MKHLDNNHIQVHKLLFMILLVQAMYFILAFAIPTLAQDILWYVLLLSLPGIAIVSFVSILHQLLKPHQIRLSSAIAKRLSIINLAISMVFFIFLTSYLYL